MAIGPFSASAPSGSPIIRTKPFRARLRRDVSFDGGQLLYAGGEVRAEPLYGGKDARIFVFGFGVPDLESKSVVVSLRDLEAVDGPLPGVPGRTIWDWLVADD